MATWLNELLPLFLRFNYAAGSSISHYIIDNTHPIYVKQRNDWDCGIACILMILKIREMNSIDLTVHDILPSSSAQPIDVFASNGDLISRGVDIRAVQELLDLTTPLWTIDLFIGLIDSGIQNIEMHTCCIGVSQSLHLMEWYVNHLPEDGPRVQSKFDLAKVSLRTHLVD